MSIDPAAARSLQISKEERHPSIHGIGPAKEGLSLLGLLDQTVSAPGKHLIKEWVCRPLLEIEAINRRLDAVSCFYEMVALVPDTVNEIRKSMRNIRDLASIVARLRTSRATVNDWAGILQSCVHISKIQDILQLGQQRGSNVPLVVEVRFQRHTHPNYSGSKLIRYQPVGSTCRFN
jgi:DNA mismatch repair ATPase MutS